MASSASSTTSAGVVVDVVLGADLGYDDDRSLDDWLAALVIDAIWLAPRPTQKFAAFARGAILAIRGASESSQRWQARRP